MKMPLKTPLRAIHALLRTTTAITRAATQTGLARLTGEVRAFGDNRSGAVAVIFGVMMIPVIALAGSALDFSRVWEDRSEALNAADAASLAGSRALRGSNADVERTIRQYLDANLPPHMVGAPYTYTINEDRTGLRVDLEGVTKTTILGVIGVEELEWVVTSEASGSSIFTEIALVLDVTGSMRTHMEALKEASNDFVDVIFAGQETMSDARIAIVPYRYTVNIGNGGTQMAWMDTTAESRFHGVNFEDMRLRHQACRPSPPPPGPPPPPPPPGPPSPPPPPPPPGPPPPPAPPSPPPPPPPPGGGSDWGVVPYEPVAPVEMAADALILDMVIDRSRDMARRASDVAGNVAGELIGVSEAHAIGSFEWDSGDWPYGPRPTVIPGPPDLDCRLRGPDHVNHFVLFDAMNERWGGCVEARPEPFDTSDVPPGGNPDTRWVPYLWPDERDGVNGSNRNAHSRNDYLPTNPLEPDNIWGRDWQDRDRQRFVWKYNVSETGNLVDSDYTSFIEQGPNAACPEPIVPLTGNRAELDSAIDSLRSVGAAGTNSAFGMVWGWRVLSPGAPFTQGLPYDPENNQKIIILMTDGVNDVTRQRNGYNQADYGAYGYLRQRRLGRNIGQARNALDDKLEEVCREVAHSDRGILVYTVMFDPQGGLPGSLRDLYRGCATESDMFFEATNREALVDAFNDIAADIRALRLTR